MRLCERGGPWAAEARGGGRLPCAVGGGCARAFLIVLFLRWGWGGAADAWGFCSARVSWLGTVSAAAATCASLNRTSPAAETGNDGAAQSCYLVAMQPSDASVFGGVPPPPPCPSSLSLFPCSSFPRPRRYLFRRYIDGGNWRHATDQATTLDGSGNLNNVITVESSAIEFDLDHSSDSDTTTGGPAGTSAASASAVANIVGRRGPRADGAGGSPVSSYDCALPEPAVVEPPALPPHLCTPSLRTGTTTGCSRAPGTTRVDACGHVRLNHLFIAVPYDGVCCVGVVRRYRTTKQVTSLVYLAEAEVNE